MDGAASGSSKLAQLPDEMFQIIRAAGHSSSSSSSSTTTSLLLGPRLGRLALPGRRVIDTPHHLGISSRGVVPHITQDTFRRDTNISGVYAALEDCEDALCSPLSPTDMHAHSVYAVIERAPKHVPPIYNFHPPDGASPLRKFVALPDDVLLVLGARRNPPVVAPPANPNTDTTVSVCTSVGFRLLYPEDYAQAVENLQADVVVGLGDIPYGRALGNKRVEKATDRIIQWLQDHVALRTSSQVPSKAKLFPSLLPVSCAKQQYYMDHLTNELAPQISGLAFFTTDPLEDLPEAVSHLPRLGLTALDSPHELLQQISLGLDVFTVPFIGAATDAGIALDFEFPASKIVNGCAPLPLGIDMWSPKHAVDLSPFTKGCQCYACTNHHRAYVQHLLAAKEMLGWVLLQIHNHHIIDMFFEAVRCRIAQGTFEQDRLDFAKAYESTLPEKTGQGPRIRGYQYKSEGPGEIKRNPAAYNTINDIKEKLAEAAPPSVDTDSKQLQDQGFAMREE